MREVDYSNIALGVESSPSFGEHIQGGMVDRFAALLKALTNDSDNQVVKIYGCEMNVAGSQYDQTAGAVYYNGIIYSVDAFSGNHATNIPVYVLDNAFTRQAWYGDSVKRDTFFNRKLKLQIAAAGSGIADYDQAAKLQDKLSDFISLQTKINAAVAALVNSSPAILDTLGEIATSLGNDPNLAATLTALIATKAPNARVIQTSGGIQGGGDLSADRDFSISDQGVSSEKIADLAVATLKVADSAITNVKIADSAVGTSKIANGAVGADKTSIEVFSHRYNPTTDLDTFSEGSIEFVTGAAANAPVSGSSNYFLVISHKWKDNGSIAQVAIQLEGTGVGTIYYRYKIILNSYTAWSTINTP